MILTADAQVIISLCSHLGLAGNSDASPFSTREWNQLSNKLRQYGMRPEELLQLEPEKLIGVVDQNQEAAERINQLLGRTGSLAIELERLESLGIGVVTQVDNDYPTRYTQRLKESAPALLFYSGERALLGQPGVAIVGSRNLDEVGEQCADFIGNASGLAGLVLYSGGARGVDSLSMKAALDARGFAVGIVADSLEKAIRNPEYRSAIAERNLCLATPYSPSAPFSVGNAMGRNRLIYTLADFAIVVASDFEKGGTWAGASEALKAGWLPVFALQHEQMPLGNIKLIERGAIPLPHPFPGHHSELFQWLQSHSPDVDPSEQMSLF